MFVTVTEFVNPFTFYCIPEKEKEPTNETITSISSSQYKPLDKIRPVDHGQYVAILHESNWVRGIVSLEDRLLFWLVDYGYYLRPTERTVFVELPTQYKRLPSKVFEASLHGVAPVDKVLDVNCEIVNSTSTKWIIAAIEKSKELIAKSDRQIFVPVAVISSKLNDVVIGELYLHDKKLGGFVNLVDELEKWPVFLERTKEFYIQSKFNNFNSSLVDELEKWPVFLERTKEFYIQNLPKFYKNRRIHHACQLKPEFSESKIPNLEFSKLTLDTYNAICETTPKFEVVCDRDSSTESGATYISMEISSQNNCSYFKLTPEEIEQYSEQNIVIDGEEHNVLTILINKARDLEQCAKYKDKKSVGRANTRCPPRRR